MLGGKFLEDNVDVEIYESSRFGDSVGPLGRGYQE